MNCIANKTKDIKKIIEIVADNMLATRPKKDVIYRPYIKQDGINHAKPLSYVEVDFHKFYPLAKRDDIAYATTMLTSDREQDIYLCVNGNIEVFFEDKLVFAKNDPMGTPIVLDMYTVGVTLKKGYNKVVIKCICDDDSFSFKFVPSLRIYPTMWAVDYLFATKITLPIKEYQDEEGFAIAKTYDAQIYDFPKVYKSINKVDFNKIYNSENGEYAYALTYCKENCEIFINESACTKVFINKREVKGQIQIEKEDEIFVECRVQNGEWSFELQGSFYIPFLETKREYSNWLLLGEFAESIKLEIQFKKPYKNANSEDIFWRMNSENTYLRPYLETTFYGQWFYALMVGHIGLKQAAISLGSKKYHDYFCDSIATMADYFDYLQYDYKQFGCPTFLQRSTKLEDLDSIGTIGMNLVEAYHLTRNENIRSVISILSKAMFENISRFSDGAFYRGKTMWADDLYMSCPFLVRLGNLTGETFYYDQCLTQLRGFKNRLYMEDKKIFSHIFFVEESIPNRIPWGRGNGWVLVALSEILEKLPADYKGRSEIIDLFCEFAEGIIKLQDETGMWHQVLDREESYLETSATAMFTLALARGVKNNYIGKKYTPYIQKAWTALTTHCIDENGNVYGVCKGSGCSMEAKYYSALETVNNDDHGTGIILMAACEMENIIGI
jgi:rhamnogalacturonyl hydrolase YesR